MAPYYTPDVLRRRPISPAIPFDSTPHRFNLYFYILSHFFASPPGGANDCRKSAQQLFWFDLLVELPHQQRGDSTTNTPQRGVFC
jgi:hypothetical protein